MEGQRRTQHVFRSNAGPAPRSQAMAAPTPQAKAFPPPAVACRATPGARSASHVAGWLSELRDDATPSTSRSPPGAVRLAQTWSQVAMGSSVASVASPGFSVPFTGAAAAPGSEVAVDSESLLECCFLEPSEDLWHMELHLAHEVVVTIIRTRPQVDLAAGGPGCGGGCASRRIWHRPQ